MPNALSIPQNLPSQEQNSPDIVPSERAIITCQEDLNRTLLDHQIWIEKVLDLGSNSLKGRANFQGCTLRGYNLEGANLMCSDLRGADLTESNLKGANLSRAKLDQAILYKANLTGATLNKASLKGTDLREALLEDVSLESVDFSMAILRDADIRRVRNTEERC